ncbi:MAG: hypothetical protein AAFY91_09505, partial [Bacteroidota bacterium]
SELVHNICFSAANCDEVTFQGLPTTPVDATCEDVPGASTVTATIQADEIIDPFVFISEFHYDNDGGDVGEFIEVTGTAGFNLDGYSLVLYNGNGGGTYNSPIDLSGNIIDDEGDGFGALDFQLPSNGLQNGSPDGFALVDDAGTVLQFLSYEGSFTATSGDANGLTSTDVGVAEAGNTPIGQSLQLTGTGCADADFEWNNPTAESPGDINTGLVFDGCPTSAGGPVQVPVAFMEEITPGNCVSEFTITRTWTVERTCGFDTSFVQVVNVIDTVAPTFDMMLADTTIECDESTDAPVVTGTDNCDGGDPAVWINEFHYDNVGGDTGEFVEVAGTAGFDLTGYTIVLYNGSGGVTYDTDALSGTIPNQANGFGTVDIQYPSNGLQNGSPDGIALVDAGGNVVQFISYEGDFTATNGPAAGMMAMDVMVSEPGTTPVGQSLQLVGQGSAYADFTWTGPADDSPGSVNSGQTFAGSIIATSSDVVTPGINDNNFTIERTFTIEDDCGNSRSFMQTITVEDSTPPVLECNDTITVELSATGDTVVSQADIVALVVISESDNCELDPNGPFTVGGESARTFDCDDVGAMVTITQVIDDRSGNSDDCTAVVEVLDVTPPTLECPDTFTSFLDENGIDTTMNSEIGFTADDACMVEFPIARIIGGINNRVFGCDDAGETFPRDFFVTDNSGNSSDTCTVLIEVLDTISPTLTCVNDTVFLDAMGAASFDISELIVDTDDNCEVLEPAADVREAGCDDVNTQLPFTLTVEDPSGNSASCDVLVLVRDIIAPVITCPADVTIECDAPQDTASTGNATVVENCSAVITFSDSSTQVLDGSCDEFTYEIFRTFIATDPSGNADTCVQLINVEDTQAPDLVCNTITVETDDLGNIRLTDDDLAGVIAGTTDNCDAGFTAAFSQLDFDCSDIDPETTQITVDVLAEDACENDTMCTVNLDVAPALLNYDFACITELNVTLNDDCQAMVIPSMVLSGDLICLDLFEFDIVVMDENPDNGPIIDGCGRYQYMITEPEADFDAEAPDPIEGFTGAFAEANWGQSEGGDAGDATSIS